MTCVFSEKEKDKEKLLKAKKWSDEDNDKMIKIAKEFIS
jgi:hypothetical protein